MRTIVVARNNEDISWAKDYDNVFVVQKEEHLPNWGREPSSYLWYIINHYDELEGDYVFLQGNPFEHTTREEVVSEIKGFRWFGADGRNGLVCNMRGQPHDNVDIRKFLELIGLSYEGEELWFNGCAQFGVSAERIRSRPKSFYEKTYEVLMSTSERFEYAFERLVGVIFGG